MFLDGADVSEEIRQDDVTTAVSAVSAHPEVRAHLVEMQRDWVDEKVEAGVWSKVGTSGRSSSPMRPEDLPRRRARGTCRSSGGGDRGELRGCPRRHQSEGPFRLDQAASPLIVPDGAVVVDTSEFTFDAGGRPDARPDSGEVLILRMPPTMC